MSSLDGLEQRIGSDYPEGFGELEGGGEVTRPTNCSGWFRLQQRGFEPTTTLEAQGNSFAFVRCNALALLKRARPSQSSYVRQLGAPKRLLSILPAAVASGLDSDRAAARDEAVSAGKTLHEFDPKATITRATRRKDGFEIDEGSSGG